MAPSRPKTPLRQVSQGSLRRLSRSNTFADAPHGLGFLEPAMAELADEAETLQSNVASLNDLSRSLATFNESFASYLYVMQMNSLTVDWVQVPNEASYKLAKRRAEQDAGRALAELEAARAEVRSTADQVETETSVATAANDTAFTEVTSNNSAETSGKPTGVKKPAVKKGKPKLTAKERKERNLAIEKTINCLPLEFRGSDPDRRKNMEAVIEHFMNNNQNGVRLQDMIKPPDLNQARVNKCLIALVNRKIVTKDNSSGQVLYTWGGVPS